MKPIVFKVGNKKIGDGQPVFIVAELSGNHNQDINKAYQLIDAAAEANVDAVKLQTYTPDTITLNSNLKWFQIDKQKKWGGQTLYELYKTAYTPWEWQPKLKEYGEKKGLIVFSTPFDVTAVDFLKKLKMPLYKISSFEIIHLPLLKKVAQTKKPVFLSRGLAGPQDIKTAVATLRANGTPAIVVLQCISSYPAELKQMNIATLTDIRHRFKVLAGLSDHSLGITAAATAVALGACVVEKHLTLARNDGGPDAAFSLEPHEMKKLVTTIRDIETAKGKITYTPDKKETEFLKYKPSIFVVANVKQGEIFSRRNTRIIRPGYGLHPKYYEAVLGKRAKTNLSAGTPLTWTVVQK